MMIHPQHDDYFSSHRKHHGGRPLFLTLAFLASAGLWALIFRLGSTLL